MQNPWFAFWLGDYARDTSQLSMTEHGAYINFMRHYYGTGKSIPDSRRYFIAGAFSPEEQQACDAVLNEYFYQEDGHWLHERIEKELKTQKEISEKNSQKAKKAAEARWRKSNSDAPSNAPSMPQAMQQASAEHASSISSSNAQSQSQSQLSDESNIPPISPEPCGNLFGGVGSSNDNESKKDEKPQRRTTNKPQRLWTHFPECKKPEQFRQHIPQDWIDYAVAKGHSREATLNIAENFWHYFVGESPGDSVNARQATAKSWSQKWQTWIRGQQVRNAPSKDRGSQGAVDIARQVSSARYGE